MKSFTNWINGAAVLGVSAMIAVGYGVAGPAVDTLTVSSVIASDRADRFMVVDHTHNRTCILALHRADGYDIHRIEPGHCDAMPAKLSAARTWQDTGNGVVRITDAHGSELMRLAAGDTYGWNVVEPQSLAMSFEAF